MQIDIQQKLLKDKQMMEFLKQNSNWFKQLNRNPTSYNEFISTMKEKYKTRATDKMSGLMENIDMISSVLNILK